VGNGEYSDPQERYGLRNGYTNRFPRMNFSKDVKADSTTPAYPSQVVSFPLMKTGSGWLRGSWLCCDRQSYVPSPNLTKVHVGVISSMEYKEYL